MTKQGMEWGDRRTEGFHSALAVVVVVSLRIAVVEAAPSVDVITYI